MISDEILTKLQSLDRADKLRAMQFLLQEIAKDENTILLPNDEYPVWTPYDADEAAQTLREYMEARKAKEKS